VSVENISVCTVLKIYLHYITLHTMTTAVIVLQTHSIVSAFSSKTFIFLSTQASKSPLLNMSNDVNHISQII